MKLRMCSLSLKASTAFVCMVEAIALAAITIFSFLGWKEINRDAIFFYARKKTDSNAFFNGEMSALVTFWILTMLMVSASIRILSIYLAVMTHTKRSTNCGKLWIVMKLGDVFLTTFLLIGSFTVGLYPTIAAAVDLILGILTLYHVKKLNDSFPEFERGILNKKDKNQDDS